VRLLFDENLSHRLVLELATLYPGSQHVDSVGLHGQPDLAIWSYARQRGFVIVSKDDDFRQLSFLHGAPPKVIWLRVGNAGIRAIAALLEKRRAEIEGFSAGSEESLLILA
jgi:predicted nuclease of predicted toxin-antitoxin system